MKKSRKDPLFAMLDWLGKLLIFGSAGLILGFIISVNLGNYISGEPVLTETRPLEPIVVGSREIFLIKKGDTYFYFTKDKQFGSILKTNSTNTESTDIEFENEVREERKYKKVFKNPKLNWMFFKEVGYIEIVVSSKEDIL